MRLFKVLILLSCLVAFFFWMFLAIDIYDGIQNTILYGVDPISPYFQANADNTTLLFALFNQALSVLLAILLLLHKTGLRPVDKVDSTIDNEALVNMDLLGRSQGGIIGTDRLNIN